MTNWDDEEEEEDEAVAPETPAGPDSSAPKGPLKPKQVRLCVRVIQALY